CRLRGTVHRPSLPLPRDAAGARDGARHPVSAGETREASPPRPRPHPARRRSSARPGGRGGGIVTRREFRLPDLGEGLTESDIVAWRIAEGDSVELNQVIAEIETAKALVELPSPCAGVVSRLHAAAGDTVGVGEPLVTFEWDDAGPDELPPNRVGYGATAERAGRPQRRSRSGSPRPTPARSESRHERRPSTPPVRRLARELGV